MTMNITSTQGRRTADQRVLTSAFCGPVADGDIKLRLKHGAMIPLESKHKRVETSDLIAAAKLACPPLSRSIDSRYMAIAILQGTK